MICLPPPERPLINRTVTCITGRYDISGILSSAAKWHYRSLRSFTPRLNEPDSTEATKINFSSKDARMPSHNHHDALVITILIAKCLVKKALVDNESSTKIMFLYTLCEMRIPET